ncbi:LysR family transcriptional regulator [Actinoplanes bogorensis]|uniref:LysR family transcriptional regulator n=1 Tax=Paractinoplanes bogorensis TaxID=1610840 RepID=A0ABS5YG56_9ACTN|nr:LysR substrate-binding domain-containing protein [Actinoplanes bogorensis]MBU2662317.1 LysR family transcriptional regulator [Actinoplanes bogorensis]
MLDVTRLRVLAAVARHGSVTAAAEALHYAQPSVSHHLARLEAETGSRLVQRSGRGIRLTEAGRLLADRAEEILGRLDAAEEELAAHAGLRAGRVRLAAFPSALGTFVPVAAAAFDEAYPGIDLRFREAEPPAAIDLLRRGEVDVAVIFTHEDVTGLRTEELFEDETYLVTPLDWAGDGLADHRGRRWIGGCERCRAELLRACAAEGFTPDIRFTTDDYVAVQQLVARNLGVTTLPGLALAAHRNERVRVVPLPGRGRRVLVAVAGEAPDPPATRALTEMIRASSPRPPAAEPGHRVTAGRATLP